MNCEQEILKEPYKLLFSNLTKQYFNTNANSNTNTV